jgi:hypothetical protein
VVSMSLSPSYPDSSHAISSTEGGPEVICSRY